MKVQNSGSDFRTQLCYFLVPQNSYVGEMESPFTRKSLDFFAFSKPQFIHLGKKKNMESLLHDQSPYYTEINMHIAWYGIKKINRKQMYSWRELENKQKKKAFSC